jgi:predicted nucleic acid-binding protein
VTCEVLSRGNDDHLRHLRALLQALEYVSTSPGAARRAAELRRQRHQAGGKLGLGDALIAAVAEDLGAVVVTRNRPDFERQGIEVLTY